MKKSPKRIYGTVLAVGGLLMCGFFSPSLINVSAQTTNFTGSLSGYLTIQETKIDTMFASGYTRVYTQLSQTGLALLQSIEYQSLICLGALPTQSILDQLQTDKTNLQISIHKDFTQLENNITALEDKKTLQQQTNIDLFTGSSYQGEKNVLKATIDTKVLTDAGFIVTFESGYMTKIKNFVTLFTQYVAANKDLLKAIADKMTTVQSIFSGFTGLQIQISNLYDVMGVDVALTKLETLKTTALTNLENKIDPFVAVQIRIFKKLTGLSGDSLNQKFVSINQYKLDIDEYFASAFQKLFDYAKYTKLKDQITSLRTSLYVGTRLNCANVIGTDPATITQIAQDITKLTSAVISGTQKAQTMTGGSFATALISGFQNIYTKGLESRFIQFKNNLRLAIQAAVRKLTSSTTSGSIDTGATDAVVTPVFTGIAIPVGFLFTQPFTLLQKGNDVKILQQILIQQGLFSGVIDWVFTYPIKDALYQFQLKYKILTPSSKASLRGLFGPATRKVANALLK